MSKLKSLKFNAQVLCHALVSVKEGIDPSEFIKNGNEYIIEPKNADGCVISFNPKEVTILQRGFSKKPNNNNENNPDRYLHFSFRGAKICVDTEERTVISTKKAKAEEMIGPKENKMWPLNVETSN